MNHYRHSNWPAAGLAALTAAFLVTSAHAQSGEPIKIGVIAEVQSIAGAATPGGAQIAADEINAKGGVGGLDLPDGGRVRVADHDVTAMSEHERLRLRRTSVAFIFQSFGLIPILSAAENVGVPLRIAGVAPREREDRVRLMLDIVGLGEHARQRPAELSGGQQQRVAIARALVKEPKVLLADEPTGNLDEDTRDEIIGLLEQIWRERALTMVQVTHDTAVARRAQRIGLLKNGRLTVKRAPQPAGEPGMAPQPAE